MEQRKIQNNQNNKTVVVPPINPKVLRSQQTLSLANKRKLKVARMPPWANSQMKNTTRILGTGRYSMTSLEATPDKTPRGPQKTKSERYRENRVRIHKAKKLQEEAQEMSGRKCYTGAIEKLTKALDFLPEKWQLYAARAHTYYLLNDLDHAFLDYCEAIRHKQPAHPQLYSKRAHVLQKLGRMAAALEDMDTACKLGPKLGLYYFQRGCQLAHYMNRINDGYEDFAKAKELRSTIDVETQSQILYQHGLCLQLLGKPEEAIEDLKESHRMNRVFTPCIMALGNCYLDIGDLERAETIFKKGIGLGPAEGAEEEARMFFSLGLLHYQKEDYPKAIEHFNKAVTLDPSEAAYHFQRARSLLRLPPASPRVRTKKNNATLKNALMSMELAMKLQPDQVEYLHTVGIIYFRKSEYAVSADYLDKALKLDRSFLPSLFYMGLVQHQLGDYPNALEYLDKIVSRVKDDFRVFEARAFTYYELGQWHLAAEDLDKALGLAPERIGNYYKRAQCMYRMGEYQDSLDGFNRVLEKVTHPESDIKKAMGNQPVPTDHPIYIPAASLVLSSRAMVFRAMGRLQEAMDDLNEAILDNPNDNELLFNRGMCLASMAQWEQGLDDFRRGHEIALEKQGDNGWKYLLQVGICQYHLRHYHEAVASFEAAFVEGGSIDPETAATLHNYRGQALTHLELYDQAQSAYSDAIQVAEKLSDDLKHKFVYERAKVHLLRRSYEEALEDFNTILEVDEKDARAHFMRAWAYKAMGCYEAAVDDFQLSQELDPTNPYLVVDYKTVHNIDCIVLNDR